MNLNNLARYAEIKPSIDQCATWAELATIAYPGTLSSWMTMTERPVLFDVARSLKPGQRSLEIGLCGGCTLKMFAMLVEDGVEVYGMDSWENDTPVSSVHTGQRCPLREGCMSGLEIDGVAHRVTIVDGSSHDLAPTWDKPLDFLMIDGDHTQAGALQDLRDYAKWVVGGGRMVMDDYYNQVRTATDRWLGDHGSEWIIEHMYQAQEGPAGGKMLTLRRVVT